MHPEAYDLARKIVLACGRDLRAIQSNPNLLRSAKPESFTTEKFGLPTVRDILQELDKPGRDPRPSFKTASFAEGVEDISDLQVGMRLEGTVTNVAAFGAFADIGVHQDRLVHVSQLADRFVKDPHEVVKAGDVVQVRVTKVDAARKRIALTMRADGAAAKGDRDNRPSGGANPDRHAGRKPDTPRSGKARIPAKDPSPPGALGDALLEAMKKR